MAVIPKAETSTRRIGVLPQVQSYQSQWGEVGRSVSGVIDAGLSAAERYQQMQDTRLRTNYQLAERAKALAEQQKAAADRENDRVAHDIAGEMSDQMSAGLSGTVQTDANGQQKVVPGIFSLTPDQLDAQHKSVADLYGELAGKVRQNKRYAEASPEVREKVDRLMAHQMQRFNGAVAAQSGRIKLARDKEYKAKAEERINRRLMDAEHMDQQTFDYESNLAALRKIGLEYSSAIANKEILDSDYVEENGRFRALSIADLKLTGAKDESDPRYARMREDYKKLIAQQASNRITNLTRLAATDTSVQGVAPEALIAQADQTRDTMLKYGLCSPEQHAALGELVNEAKTKMDGQRKIKLDAVHREARAETVKAEYEMLSKAPVPEAQEAKVAYYNDLSSRYRQLSENAKLSDGDRLHYLQISQRLSESATRQTAAQNDAVKDANYARMRQELAMGTRYTTAGDSNSYVQLPATEQKAYVDAAFKAGDITPEQWGDLSIRAVTNERNQVEGEADNFSTDLMNQLLVQFPALKPKLIQYDKDTNSVYFNATLQQGKHGRVTAESKVPGLVNVWGPKRETSDATYGQLIAVVQSVLNNRRAQGKKMTLAEACEEIKREFGPTHIADLSRSAAEKISRIQKKWSK